MGSFKDVTPYVWKKGEDLTTPAPDLSVFMLY